MESIPEMTEQAEKTYFIQTFGCQMNEYDSGRLKAMLEEDRWRAVDSPEQAGLVLINTCSVRQKPEDKVFSLLGKLAQLKQANPDLKVAVGGCVAQQEGKRILQRARAVDMVFGPDQWGELPAMLREAGQGKRVLRTAFREGKTPWDALDSGMTPPVLPMEGGVKGQVAIMKGCDNFCTFCIVPHTRGREVSRTPEAVVEETQALLRRGVKEILLLGQNVNSYRSGSAGFVDLLRQVAAVPGLARLRYTSPHPNDFNRELAMAHRELPNLCEQVHLPIQSGSDRVLKQMRRRHTRQQFLDKVSMLRELLPQAALSTDVIVGFPGETPEDFQQTMDLLDQVRFDQVYAFKFSARVNTPAAAFPDQIEDDQKNERLARLLARQNEIIAEIQDQAVGTRQEVLVEGESLRTHGERFGRTRANKPVSVMNSTAAPGTLIWVDITESRKHSLAGREVSP
ncbi:MAG: tRNA (N6-isopentenyl adenosine(37)-C2)-methylthiotransferase MiaB [Deltaproteobacteria bacterium]|nr:tRNA (N6-isopentenyl adenosine(37)-C2)-methylthiotransferase MiaB [Deltaproteobacteria bacterium]